MNSINDPWHYPRGDLVEQVRKTASFGLIHRLAMFAPRRKGKTAFLLQDLAPAATKRQILPIYASLWANPNAPHKPIIAALEEGMNAISARRIPWKKHLTSIQRVSLNVGVATATWQSVANAPQQPSSDELLAVGNLLRMLIEAKNGPRIFLLIDEAQHLVTSKRFDGLTAALRTALDTQEMTNTGKIFTLFTGSSRTNLSRLLNDPKAPFYRSVERIDLPDLTSEYTDFVCDQLKKFGRIHVPKTDCWEAFKTFNYSPFHMESFIRSLLLRRTNTSEQAIEEVMFGIGNDPEYLMRWQSVRDIDQLVYLNICEGHTPFSADTIARIAAALNQKSVHISQIQRAVKRLIDSGFIASNRQRGYQNEDYDFLAWLRYRQGN